MVIETSNSGFHTSLYLVIFYIFITVNKFYEKYKTISIPQTRLVWFIFCLGAQLPSHHRLHEITMKTLYMLVVLLLWGNLFYGGSESSVFWWHFWMKTKIWNRTPPFFIMMGQNVFKKGPKLLMWGNSFWVHELLAWWKMCVCTYDVSRQKYFVPFLKKKAAISHLQTALSSSVALSNDN